MKGASRLNFSISASCGEIPHRRRWKARQILSAELGWPLARGRTLGLRGGEIASLTRRIEQIGSAVRWRKAYWRSDARISVGFKSGRDEA